MSAASRISTVIATYNRPHFLREVLDCLAAQHLPPLEVIVVDDGSGPEVCRAVDAWRARQARAGFELRYVYQDNSGPAVARNRGIAESRGDILHFMDDDDLMEPDTLQHLAAALGRAQGAALSMGSYALLHHGADTHTADTPVVTPCRDPGPQVLAAMIAGSWFVPIHGYLFTRAAVVRMGPWDPSLSSQEDDEFLFRAALQAVDFIPAREALVYYRQHDGVRRATPGKPGETLRQGLRKRLHDDLAMREAVFQELRARGTLAPYREAFHAWHRRLVERYAPLLQELESEAWPLLSWLGHAIPRACGAAGPLAPFRPAAPPWPPAG